MGMTAQGMLDKIKAARVSLEQTSSNSAALSHSDKTILAFCQGIINEIVANAELVPVSTDSGSAGSGIITGKVK
jgi:hypothetical protein